MSPPLQSVQGSAAYHLARKGLSVALLEKGRIAGEQSSRNRNWRRQQNRDEREIALIKQLAEPAGL
jgi:glycine/D-amino acid oxidase-like deaminating enzyme